MHRLALVAAVCAITVTMTAAAPQDHGHHPRQAEYYLSLGWPTRAGVRRAEHCYRVRLPNTTGYGVIARTFLAALEDRR